MKIVSSLLESIEGIRIYYIIGLLIFVVLFIVILIRTIRMSNNKIDKIKKSILTDDDPGEIMTSN